MKEWVKSCGALAMTVLVLALLPASGLATEVCRFTEVIGQVNLLKSGAGQAVSAKLEMGAAEKDTINTKLQSRAQLKFIDNSILSVSPLSDVVIEEYMYDAAKGTRQAVAQLTQGVIHAVVTNLQKVKEPDFLIKTPTAIMGVRGSTVVVISGRDDKGQPFALFHVSDGLADIIVVDPTGKFVTSLSSGGALVVLAGQIPSAKDIVLLKGADAARLNKLVDTGIPLVGVRITGANLGEVLNSIIVAVKGPETGADQSGGSPGSGPGTTLGSGGSEGSGPF